jgi:hypothetical protein
VPVFVHNAIDILSLACLTGVIPESFRDPENVQARHGTDLLGLARWLELAGKLEQAWSVTRRAIDLGLPDRHLFRALFEAGRLEKRMERFEESVATFCDLTASPNPYQQKAWAELAKHYEHREKNLAMAIECARAACDDSRIERLEARRARTAKSLRLRRVALPVR